MITLVLGIITYVTHSVGSMHIRLHVGVSGSFVSSYHIIQDLFSPACGALFTGLGPCINNRGVSSRIRFKIVIAITKALLHDGENMFGARSRTSFTRFRPVGGDAV